MLYGVSFYWYHSFRAFVSMYKTLMISVRLFISFTCLAQKNDTWIYGTVQIDRNTSMKNTEVTLQEWIVFIINNNFDSSLFPENNCLSASSGLLFSDFKKGHHFEYLQIINNSRL